MSDRTLVRAAAAGGILSFVATFVGFGIHGGLPSDTTADAVRTYVNSIGAGQAGLGNYIELLGYVLLLVFVALLYAVARAATPDRFHLLNVLGLTAAVVYVAVSAAAIAGQLVMVEWLKAGADAKTVLGIYIFDSDAFTLSFQLAALFGIALGIPLATGRLQLRVIGISGIVVGLIAWISGLLGTASINDNISQLGFLSFIVWTLLVSIYLLIQPPPITRALS